MKKENRMEEETDTKNGQKESWIYWIYIIIEMQPILITLFYLARFFITGKISIVNKSKACPPRR